jgi:branched-chain amino acid transport system permease protein
MTELGARAGVGNGLAALRGSLRGWGIWIATGALFLLLPQLLGSGAALTKMSLMGIMIVFALSYNMLLGQSGMLSFGHAVYYGLGGFFAVHAMNIVAAQKLPLPVALLPLVGGLAGLAFGIVFGSVSTRRAGTAFAMISLGIGELVAASSLILQGFFGGEEGISTNRTKGLRLFELSFGPQIQVYYLIAAWCFVCILAMYAITRTPFGRMCNAVRDNPERAEFIGYATQRVRFISFSLAGFFAGVAGGLAAINFEIMTAANVGATTSGAVLLMTYIGGVGHFAGPIIGAVLITLLSVSLSDITSAWLLYLGTFFILMVMFAPGGIAGLLMMHEPLLRARVIGRLLPAYLRAAGPAALLLLGIVLVIETAYYLSLHAAAEGPTMRVFGVGYDSASWLSWTVIAAVLAAGIWLFRRSLPGVAAAWGAASEAMKQRIAR